jgi:hypothetical protein
LNYKVSQGGVEVIDVDVVVGELEVVVAGVEVAVDIVAVGFRFVHRFRGIACCIYGGTWKCSLKVEHLHDPWRVWERVYLVCLNLPSYSATQCCCYDEWCSCGEVLELTE